MLSPVWHPSLLLQPHEKTRVQIGQSQPAPRYPSVPVFRRFGGYVLGNLWRRLTGRYSRDESAQRLREVFEALGGLWIKIGQLLSLRTDIFSAEVCRELSRLQNRAQGFPFEDVQALLRRELGRDPAEVFSELEPQPVAAASVCQVHRAVLRENGARVVVKVLRPSAESDFLRDLAVLRRLIATIEWFGIMKHVHWREALWELESMVREEIDFRFEAANTRRMRKVLREHEVYVPKVFLAHCTQFVMVSEYITGVLMAEYIEVQKRDPARVAEWCRENGIQPKKLGRRIFASTLRQFMEENLFHADLHPGNIILLRRNRFALIDFGTIGRGDKEFMANYKASLMAMSERDFGAAADLTLRMTISPPDARSLPALRAELVQSYREWESRTELTNTSYHSRSLASAGNESGRIMYRYRIQLTWSFMRISRTWLTLDSSLNFLIPEANYLKLFQHYFRDAQRRRLAPRRLIGGVANGAMTVLRTVDQYNALIAPLVRRHAILSSNFTSFSERAAQAVAAVLRGLRILALAGLVLGFFIVEDLYFPQLLQWEVDGVRSISSDLGWVRLEYFSLGVLGLLVAVIALRRAVRALER